MSAGKKLTLEEFIQKSNQIHNNKYDYSKSNYINSFTKICIICPEHGEFWQVPLSHLNLKKECYHCGKKKGINTRTFSKEIFIEKSKKVQNINYDYSKFIYTNANTPSTIICPIHGEFLQTPSKHYISKRGCPKCKQSHGEKIIEQYLKEHNIKYEPQKRFGDCRDIRSLPFDFYLPDFNTCIEYDGELHFRTWKGKLKKEYISNLQQTQLHDTIKTNYCENKQIKLIRISYKQFKNITLILEKEITKPQILLN